MAFSPFNPRNGGDGLRYKQLGPEHTQAVDCLRDHMVEISDDPRGSDPEGYLSPEDIQVLQEFKAYADEKGWPGAVEAGMLTGKSEAIKAWSPPLEPRRFIKIINAQNTAKAGLTKALFFSEAGGESRGRKGYIVGRLSFGGGSYEPLVAFTDDGKLVMQRDPRLPTSKGIGWGRLPDLDILNAALPIGKRYGVNYSNVKSKPLRDLLYQQVRG